MTRNDYLGELQARLTRIPQSEREEALAFYTEYFADAAGDAEAIEALGPPARLATQIIAEYSARMLEESANARRAPEPQGAADAGYKNDLAALPAPSHQYTKAPQGEAEGAPAGAPRKSGFSWTWSVILGICALPIALPAAVAAIAVVFAVAAVCLAIIVSMVAAVVALIVAGVAAVLGIGAAAMTTADGLLVAGGAIAALGLALILIPLIIRFCVWLVRSVGRLAAHIFNNLKRRSDNNA